jgi:hypothetical protein
MRRKTVKNARLIQWSMVVALEDDDPPRRTQTFSPPRRDPRG